MDDPGEFGYNLLGNALLLPDLTRNWEETLRTSPHPPVLNSSEQDPPLIQVALPGGTWGASVDARAAEFFNTLLFIHNNVVASVARNVRLRLQIGRPSRNRRSVTAIVSADNCPLATGAVLLDTMSTASITIDWSRCLLYVSEANSTGGYDLRPVDLPKIWDMREVLSPNGLLIGDIAGCWNHCVGLQFQMRLAASANA